MSKKPSDGNDAVLGRLVYGYRNLNAKVKPLNFPLANLNNLFDNISKYKIFSVIDIRNAFLSVSLTKRAKKGVQ